jgi:SAM-dependent methyltransferase
MSHAEQLGFFAEVARANGELLRGARVLEIGAYDVNGSVREQFAGASSYVGVDLAAGPGVDLVSYGHEVDHADGTYDVALSGECFEHDPHWRETFQNMVRLTRPGGLVAFTCASRGRPEHGTTRTLVGDSPGTQAQGLDYYRNLDASDFADLPLGAMFTDFRFWYLSSAFDLYFAGVRSGAPPAGEARAHLPADDSVAGLRDLAPPLMRVLRVPLRVARRLVADDDRYQRVILPYWLGLLSGQRALGRARQRLQPAAGLRT